MGSCKRKRLWHCSYSDWSGGNSNAYLLKRWGRVGASEGGTRNERILLCPWQQTEVFPPPPALEPNDDFREFSSVPRLWVWSCWAALTIWENKIFICIFYHFTSRGIISAAKLMDRAFNSKLREEKAQECLKCLLPISTVLVPLLVQGAMRMCVPLQESPGLGRSGQPLSRAIHLDMGGGHGLGIMALESWKGISLHFYIWKWGWQLYFFIVFMWWFITRCK